MNADPGPAPQDHELCDVWLFDVVNAGQWLTGEENPMRGLPGGMAVSSDPPARPHPRYLPVRVRCPHMAAFWVYPNEERVAALDAL